MAFNVDMPDLIPIPDLPPLPPRPADAHKGTFGTVIVVGGCETMPGAPALCAAAALRGGAGLVKIAAARQVIHTAIIIEPSATGIILGDDAGASLQQLDQADPDRVAVLAVGPGIGRSDAARHLVTSLLRGPRRMVLDADGLNILAAGLIADESHPEPTSHPFAAGWRASAAPPPSLVLTPHPGEFRRLAEPLGIRLSPTDPAERPAAAAALARAHAAVVLLKGMNTIITDGTRVRINTTGNPALATAGSGDVLTGLIASLMAQGMAPFDAAALAAHLHGLAADLWASRHGESGLTARDLATLLPDACNQWRRNATGRAP